MASGAEILETGTTHLRDELKAWEKAFAATNGGRKPGRADIKNDATISAKYREYHEHDRARRSTTLVQPVETPRKNKLSRPMSSHKRTALRERSENTVATTPRRAAKSVALLQDAGEGQPQQVDPTPAFIRCALGPTPQKDGQVLGIFDMFAATPSKQLPASAGAGLPPMNGTPSKASTAPPTPAQALSATPKSSGKRRLFEAFAGTPLKRKRDDEVHTPGTAKRQYATPSFLRRSFPLAPIEDDSASAPLPFQKRGLVRSLSSLIQGLRKQEDRRMDDEWDIMNELEAEEDGEAAQPPPRPASKVLVEDSQAVEMPLGPDAAPRDSDAEAPSIVPALDANGQPRKPWKKKGLKRQTKRVIMRPVLHKAQKAADVGGDDESDTELVAETQATDASAQAAGADGEPRAQPDGDAVSEYEDDPDESTNGPGLASKKRPEGKPAKKDSTRGTDGAKEAGDEAKGKKAPKKISAQSHANFRKLKIKNKNSKANGKGGRKFGRR